MAGKKKDTLLQAIRCTLLEPTSLAEAFRATEPLLRKLTKSDACALCVSDEHVAGGYRWFIAGIPDGYFTDYPEVASHDFVRPAAMGRPNEAISDGEMISRHALVRNPLYGLARDHGCSLEQVMTALIPTGWVPGLAMGAVGMGPHVGLNFYRTARRPFSRDTQDLLTHLLPDIGAAIRMHRALEWERNWSQRQSDVMLHAGEGIVWLTARGREMRRDPGADAILRRWYDGALPTDWAGRVGSQVKLPPLQRQTIWQQKPNERVVNRRLYVECTPVEHSPYQLSWLLHLYETSITPRLPTRWYGKLSPRQAEVAKRILRGWDNALIADDLGIGLSTVKQHVRGCFDNLGASSRLQLCVMAIDAEPRGLTRP